MKPYRAILFDLDSTLVNNPAAFGKTYDEFATRYPGVFRTDLPEERAFFSTYYLISGSLRKSFYQFFCAERKWENALPYEDFWNEWMLYFLQHAEAFPSSEPTVRALREKGFKLGLVTNAANAEWQMMKFRSSGLSEYFDDAVISGAVGVEKPDPAIIELAAARLGVKKEECLFVGDRFETDISCAINAGIDSVMVNQPEKYHDGATYYATDVSEVLHFV